MCFLAWNTFLNTSRYLKKYNEAESRYSELKLDVFPTVVQAEKSLDFSKGRFYLSGKGEGFLTHTGVCSFLKVIYCWGILSFTASQLRMALVLFCFSFHPASKKWVYSRVGLGWPAISLKQVQQHLLGSIFTNRLQHFDRWSTYMQNNWKLQLKEIEIILF